jgi:uncharacterized protein (DUF2147 family)
MIKRLALSFACCVALLIISAPAVMADNHSPEGLWLTENERSVISIKRCPEGYCGFIHWITEGGMQFDEKNDDPALHNRPLCGMKILWGFKQQNATNWIDGNIYKADDGDLYNATLQTLPKGTLLVRGYVGMPLFGKSQVWTPVSGADYPPCKPAHR